MPSALARELRRIAPRLRLHGRSVAFERNRETRLIALQSVEQQLTETVMTAYDGIMTT